MKLFNFSRTLRGKVFLYIFLASIIPLLISLVIVYVSSRKAIIALTRQTMSNQIEYILKMCQIQSDELDAPAIRNVDRAFTILENLAGGLRAGVLINRVEKHTIQNQDTLE